MKTDHREPGRCRICGKPARAPDATICRSCELCAPDAKQGTTLERASARWHSDDPIVCLQRALVELEQLERREEMRERPPMERVIEGLQNLSRIADTLEQLAGIEHPAMPTGTPGELFGALVGAAMGSALERAGDGQGDELDDEPTSEGH